MDGVAVEENLPVVEPVGPEDEARGLGSPRPHEAGKTDDLACADLEGDVSDGAPRGFKLASELEPKPATPRTPKRLGNNEKRGAGK